MRAPHGAGKLYLVDTSVFARRSVPIVATVLEGLIREGVAASCVTVDLEAGFSSRSAKGIEALMTERKRHYRTLQLTEEIAEKARNVQLRMAQRGHHRAAGIVDILTAAVAEHYGATVLHYDSDFEHIAAVTGQAQLWVAPRGSLD
jgi:predicted nucleic acid-binding protein